MKIHTTLVMDRSGSMDNCATDAEGGVNKLVEDSRKLDPKDTFTLVQFDTEYEVVHNAVPFDNVTHYTFVPRGGTALLDSIGRAINETGESLKKMPESERPGKVLFIIFTDGYENASRIFSKQQIKDMIQHQTTKYSWEFVYMGANQDAFCESGNIGIFAANAINYASTPVGTRSAFTTMSSSRSAYKMAGGQTSSLGFFEGKTDVDEESNK